VYAMGSLFFLFLIGLVCHRECVERDEDMIDAVGDDMKLLCCGTRTKAMHYYGSSESDTYRLNADEQTCLSHNSLCPGRYNIVYQLVSLCHHQSLNSR
jgi:hypothetical protein